MRRTLSLAFAAALILAAAPAHAAGLKMIDAHSQIPGGVSEEAALALMDEAGIAHVILSPEGHHEPRKLIAFARAHPDRITASIGLKGRKFTGNDPEGLARVRRQGQNPQIGAMSELMVLHAQKGNMAPQIITGFESAALKTALAVVRARDWPLVMHIEFGFADSNGEYDTYMKGLEELVAAHPDRPFVLSHMGQLEPKAVARLIATHPNLYFLTSHANPIFIADSGARHRWTELFAGETLTPAWKALFVAHPDRFVLAFDNVYEKDWGSRYVRQARL